MKNPKNNPPKPSNNSRKPNNPQNNAPNDNSFPRKRIKKNNLPIAPIDLEKDAVLSNLKPTTSSPYNSPQKNVKTHKHAEFKNYTKEFNSYHKVLQVFQNNPNQAFTYRQVLKKIGSSQYDKAEVIEIVHQLAKQKKINAVQQNSFAWHTSSLQSTASSKNTWEKPKKQAQSNRFDSAPYSSKTDKYVEGTLEFTSSGNAYLISPSLPNADAFIPQNRVRQAFSGDRVKARVFTTARRNRTEGEVIKVLERNKTQFTGIIRLTAKQAFLIPDKKSSHTDFFIPLNKTLNAKNGDKVVVKLIEWRENDKNPVAEVIQLLGRPGENNAEILSILADKGFPLQFPDSVLAEANQIPEAISATEITHRLDYRQVITFTIDPHDAKDFDDALSFKALENDTYEIGVHIADVTHYIKPNTLLDKEAYKRATSVYLVDRVIPMFPEKLSNELCSLRPNEEKLCFAAIFEMDKNAKILNKKFAKTIICSQKRFTYAEAQEVLETKEGTLSYELNTINELAKILRANRLRAGSIDFGSSEVKFVLDENGKPIDVYVKEIKESNQLIEDFMLLANRHVAEFINKKKVQGKSIPSINRIHDVPDMLKIENFKNLAQTFGYKINTDTPKHIAKSINALMPKIKGKPEERLLESLAVRSMAKAAYSTNTETGHYGLGFKDYAHFTSPIRRYPDVMLHRILEQCLNPKPLFNFDTETIDKQCLHVSSMERKAMEAERESVKMKQVEYLTNRIGQSFEGVISGVQQYGFFVELADNKCEGLVRTETLTHDHFQFYEKEYALIGFNTGKKYRLGDTVRVVITNTDFFAKTIDFELA